VSLLTETVGYIGASFVLTGSGVAVGQSWGDFTDWGPSRRSARHLA